MTPRRSRVMAAALCAFTMSACITAMPTRSGRPIDAEFVNSIEKGMTTIEEVRSRLGQPASTMVSGPGVTWTYRYWEGKPATFGYAYSSQRTQILTIQFQDGIVVDYSLSTSSEGT